MTDPDEIEAARRKLEDEHAEVMESLGNVFVAFEAVKASGPTDDMHHLLLELEKEVKAARDGGIIGSGANDQRRALKRYRRLTEGG